MVSAIQSIYQHLVGFVSAFLLPLFGFFRTYLLRHTRNGGLVSNDNSINSELVTQVRKSEESNISAPEAEDEVKGNLREDTELSENCYREEKQEPCFTFKFPTFEEFVTSKKQDGEFSIPAFDNTKNIFPCESSLMKEEAVLSSSGVDELILDEKSDSVEQNVSVLESLLSDVDLKPNDAAEKVGNEGAKAKSGKDVSKEGEAENPITMNLGKRVNDSRVFEESPSDGASYSERESLFTSSDSESTSMEQVRSVMSRLLDSHSDGILSDLDFEGEFEVDRLMNAHAMEIDLHSEMSDLEVDVGTEDFDGEESDIMEELDELERDFSDSPCTSEFLSERDFHEKSTNQENDAEGDNPVTGPDFAEKHAPEDTLESDSGDASKLETLWEHQELIEQLHMELKKVKATGLPTILEESESPKIMEDLKPWKIDDKFHHEDCLGELHKIHKSYRERTRKLDILNYQKMYAIGFLQRKDPLQSISSGKSSGPKLKSLLSQNFWLLKNKRHDNDPITTFMKELQCDLEVVYVGQMCLSWEVLCWQYGKALDLWESDPHGIHQYNEVADEFQQFQVLMQRFLEDEPLEGPRVQHYIRSRCVLRNLLHVPVIREDGSKDKRKPRKKEKGEFVITSEILVEILEESIRILWRFIRTDKNCSTAALKGQRGISAQLQNPEDTELLLEIRRTLLQKERKLKEVLRGQSCILRRFKKGREDDSDQVLYFFSQVDVKLVSRVLNMSRITTDQLTWCLNKLSNISFVNRRIHVEPSFLLFPC